ncbi:hypothetical protein EV385_2928 [Krasilnikovia cinnamomea]|uniref:Fibronectin type-III domain-containing protein n=1 Tax=Krasilnikovia cinnamomea TaxID=349313 RepID=A0A4Q7ZLM4_9ACTN|nr:hypothetical protein [Krasilnikovia cinnamomea]RZU51129.1 hypothetical protein EV385_2928 [Krasilnikovia cinnamomea]
MKLSRLIATAGVALAGALLAAPQAASAATAAQVPGAPMGVQQLRSATSATQTEVFWKPATFATRYRVKVVDGTTTVASYLVPATQAVNASGQHHVTVSTPNKCSAYKITVRAEDALGQGAEVAVTEKSLAPTIVTKARAFRGTDRTRATFEMAVPQWKGYLVAAGGGAKADNLSKPTIAVNLQMQLVRIADNKVISTATATQTGWTTAKYSKIFTGLDAKRAYVLKVTTANGWGSCAKQDGKILLNAAA